MSASATPRAPARASVLADIRQDLRYAARMLERSPGYALMTVLIWAVGIGSTIAMFSVVYATLLKPLPFNEPSRLMSVFLRMPVQNGTQDIDMVWSYPKYQAFQTAQRTFERTALHLAESYTVRGAEAVDVISGESIGASYFSILGLRIQLGRDFLATEDRPTGGDRSVIISDAYWRERFAGNPNAIGQTLQIGGAPYTIIGVGPKGFSGLDSGARLWTLFSANRTIGTLQSANTHQFQVIARLAQGVTPGAARQDMVTVGRAIDAAYPDDSGLPWKATAYSLNDLRLDPLVSRSVLVLAAAGALLLLIACVNVVGLQLARAAARRGELSVRIAIGASRVRLVRQLLTESLMLATFGAAAGLIIAIVAVRALAASAPLSASNLSTVRGTLTALSLGNIGIDLRATAAAIAIALITAVLAGLAPAYAAARTPVADALRSGAIAVASFGGLRRLTGRGMLVITEIALAVVLVVTSGLMIRSLSQLFSAQVGYRPDQLLTARLALPPATGDTRAVGDRWNEVLERVSRIPGVVNVAVGSCAPVGDHCEGTDIRVQGSNEQVHVSFHTVSPNYFATLGTPILHGREISTDDRAGAPRVLLVNDAAARLIWGAKDPLTIPAAYGDATIPVVGVVGDIRYEDIESAPKPAIFFAVAQQTRRRALLIVRTTGQPTAIVSALRSEIQSLEGDYVLSDVRTMRDRMFDATARNRFVTRVLGIYAGTALLLASFGIYGVLALAVAQRKRELGIRMALGANQQRVLRMILGQALSLAFIGGTAGILAALSAARAVGSLLYGVQAADPTTYVVSAVVLVASVLAAAAVPAVRAMRVNPMMVIRAE